MRQRKSFLRWAVPYVFALSILLSPAMGFAATIDVYEGESIQKDGIDKASAGDTIIVHKGTYIENIVVKKQLTIKAAGDGDVTIQAKKGSDPCIKITSSGSGSTIQGFILTGATSDDGIHLDNANNCLIKDNNIWINGHFGIHSSGSGNTISGNTISSNGTSSGKDGIYSEKSSQTAPTTITGNTIEDNEKYGIHCKQDYNTITGNNISDSGDHGVYSEGSYNNISENTLINTKPIGKDGIHIKGDNNTLSDNKIDNIQGDGVYINGKNNKIFGTSKYTQSISQCDSGIRLTKGSDFWISDDSNEIYKNALNGNTNGIHILFSSSNKIYDNSITDHQQGIHVRDSKRNEIYKNTVTSSKVGIITEHLDPLLGANDANSVHNNTISKSEISGILLIRATKGDGNNTISENDISVGATGINCFRNNSNHINDNTLKEVLIGIALESSKDTTITENNISVNVIGILFDDSSSDNVSFNRIMSIADALVNGGVSPGNVNARYNWWGSNDDPISKIKGTVDYTPYLVLKVDANPEKIYDTVPLNTSTITANLWYDSLGNYHDPKNFHVPDGIWVKFRHEMMPSLGSLKPIEAPTSNGSATSTFTATGGSGVADIKATVDSQTVSTSVTIEGLAFLSITKAESSDPVIAGRDIIYTIEVYNNGPDKAENVQLTDVIPPHLNNVRYSLDSVFWKHWPTDSEVDLGELSVDDLKSVWITGTVDPATPGGTVLTNTSSVSTTPPGHEATAEVSTTVRTIAELDLNKAVDQERPDVGERVTFTVTALNNGPSDGHDLHIDDVMPPEFSGVTITPSEGTYENGVWTIPYLAVGETATLTMQGTVTPVMAGKTTTNTATRFLFKESASASIYVPRADLYLPGEDRSCYVGKNIPITFKVGNRGPDSAENVNATFQIPDGLKFVSISVDQGTYVYDPATTTVNWDLGEVPLGDPYLYLVVRAEKVGKFTIEPTMTTTTYDPDLPDNIGSFTVTVMAIVPTLGQTGLIMLGLLFLILGALRLRCRS